MFAVNSNWFLNRVNSVKNLNIKNIKVYYPLNAKCDLINYRLNDKEIYISSLKADIDIFELINRKIRIEDLRLKNITIKAAGNETKETPISYPDSNSPFIKNKQKISYYSNNYMDNLDIFLKKEIPVDLIIKNFYIKNLKIDFIKKIKINDIDLYGNMKLINNLKHSKVYINVTSGLNSFLSIKEFEKKFKSNINLRFKKNNSTFNFYNLINLEEKSRSKNNFSLLVDINGDLQRKKILLDKLDFKYKKKDLIDVDNLNIRLNENVNKITVNNFESEIDLENIVDIVNENFYTLKGIEAKGRLSINGKGSKNKFESKILFNNLNLDYKNLLSMRNFCGEILISGKKSNIFAKNRISFDSLKGRYKKQIESIKNLEFIFTVLFDNYKNLEEFNIKTLSMDFLEGKIKGKGEINPSKNFDFVLNIEKLNFFKNFDFPLVAILNGRINLSGKSFRDIKILSDLKFEDIDYRNNNKKIVVRIPKINSSIDAFLNLYSKSVYLENFKTEFGDSTYLDLEGVLTYDKSKFADLKINESWIDLKKMNNYYKGPMIDEISGTFSISGNMRYKDDNFKLKLNNHIENLDYLYKNIDIKGLNGKLEGSYNNEDKYAVTNLKMDKAQMGDLSLRNVSVNLPVSLNKLISEPTENNVFINNFNYNGYSGNNLEGIIYISGEDINVKNLYTNFMKGQLGMSLSLNYKKQDLDLNLNGLNLNVSNSKNPLKKSEISFVSKLKGSRRDIEGYFDLTEIDKDVLDNLLISLDPDKKNPEIKMIRKRLNKFGVVPEKISIIISNGYVDIYPQLGFRTKSLLAAVIRFFVGEIEVEPIKKIPLERFLKEINPEEE